MRNNHTKHTAGPWEIVGSPEGDYCERIVADGRRDVVCELGAFHPEGMKEANAALIAAAPELLEALMEIRKLYLCPQPNTKRAWEALADVMAEYARQAIAKAEGRA